MADDLAHEPAAPEIARRGRGERARLAAGAVALVAGTAFTLSNTQKVKIDWIVTTTETPLVIALVAALLLGALLGAAAVRQRRRRRGRPEGSA